MNVVALLDAHCVWRACPAVPRIAAWFADDEIPLWQALEREAGAPVAVPYFCTAWPGAQALARFVLAGGVDVRGRTVADIGCGSGVAACAAALAGAARVLAVDSDAHAVQAAQELARRHGVDVDGVVGDGFAQQADVILAGDLVSRAAQRQPFEAAVARWRAAGRVLLADSGRPFFTSCGLPLVEELEVESSPGVDAARRRVRLYVDAGSVAPPES
jgi:predicted nicotinamide N-methyase